MTMKQGKMSKSNSKNKRLRRALGLLAVLLLSAFSCMTAFASTSDPGSDAEQQDVPYKDGYRILSYVVEADVDINNVYHITEEITADFREDAYKHGIYRSIPTSFTLMRQDGTRNKVNVSVSNIKVSGAEYEVESSSGYKDIRIGSRDEYLSGEKTFVITYDYDFGRDTGKGYDEVYFNIVGTEWSAYIKQLYFTVTLPKEFDHDRIGFTVGRYGGTDSEGLDILLEGNSVVGRTQKPLSPGEAVTIRIELPEGYFRANTLRQILKVLRALAPFMGVAAVLMSVGIANRKKVVPVISFRAPDDMNSLDVGYLESRDKDRNVISLLIYLASKGYFKIRETEEEAEIIPLKGDDVIIEDDREWLFYDGINRHKDADGVVRVEDLRDSFYRQIDGIYGKTESKWGTRLYTKAEAGVPGTVLSILAILIGAVTIRMGIVLSVTGIVFGLAGLIASRNRTKYSDDMVMLLSKVKGFKQFLTKAEKNVIEKLVEEDPEYFYNTLPYAYSLGVTNAYMKKFEGMAIKPPEWYEPVHRGVMPNAKRFDKVMNSMSEHMTYKYESKNWSSSSSSSSFGSGGGFSGGGGGGGGGRSW